jgi:DNA modification methylase
LKQLKDYEYYRTDLGVLYCGDSLKIIKLINENVDLLLTDPPYGINGGSGGTSKLRGKGNYDGSFPDTKDYIENHIVPIILNCLEISTAGIITPGNKNLCLYPQPISLGVIYQPGCSGAQRWGWADGQPIFYYGVAPLQGKKLTPCSLQNTAGPIEIKDHPCPKPLKLWEWLLLKGSINNNDLILDPFIGSGTTGLLCEKHNRRWIGIEISEKYCEIAKQRIKNEADQFKMEFT